MKIIFEMDEEWKVVKNYPYAVSNFGRVKRIESGQRTFIGKMLKPGINCGGYFYIILYKNAKAKEFRVNRLVARCFLGPCPKEKQVNHIDGNKLNNKVWNLEYITLSENVKHAYKLGLKKTNKGKEYNCGTNHPQAKLKNSDVLKIRKLYKAKKYTQEGLARKFSCSRANISHIVNNRIWNHVV